MTKAKTKEEENIEKEFTKKYMFELITGWEQILSTFWSAIFL